MFLIKGNRENYHKKVTSSPISQGATKVRK